MQLAASLTLGDVVIAGCFAIFYVLMRRDLRSLGDKLDRLLLGQQLNGAEPRRKRGISRGASF